MMAVLPSSRLLILACSATKRDGLKYMPAIDRYDGPFWRSLRAVDPQGEKAQVAFLSAHLGFRDAKTPIEIYEARMTEAIATAMRRAGSVHDGRVPAISGESCRMASIRGCILAV